MSNCATRASSRGLHAERSASSCCEASLDCAFVSARLDRNDATSSCAFRPELTCQKLSHVKSAGCNGPSSATKGQINHQAIHFNQS